MNPVNEQCNRIVDEMITVYREMIERQDIRVLDVLVQKCMSASEAINVDADYMYDRCAQMIQERMGL